MKELNKQNLEACLLCLLYDLGYLFPFQALGMYRFV